MRRPPSTARPDSQRAALLAERARTMRHAPTSSEARLFEALRASKLGVVFRRQVPVLGRFIADLLAPELRLIVEVDGPYHSRRLHLDARRDRALRRDGYHVLRLDHELVLRDLPAAAARVRDAIERLMTADE